MHEEQSRPSVLVLSYVLAHVMPLLSSCMAHGLKAHSLYLAMNIVLNGWHGAYCGRINDRRR